MSNGLRVGPNRKLSQVPRKPIVGLLVLPMMIAPAFSMRSANAQYQSGDAVLQRADAAEGGRPAGLEVEQVLDRGRHAVQRAERGAAGMSASSAAFARAARVVEALEDEGVEARIAALDAGDQRVHHLDRREVAAADAHRHFGGAHIGEFVSETHRLLACAPRLAHATLAPQPPRRRRRHSLRPPRLSPSARP